MTDKQLQKWTLKRGVLLLIFLAFLVTLWLSIYLDKEQILWGNLFTEKTLDSKSLVYDNTATVRLTEDDFCRFRALSPEEELEERLLLESNAWPQNQSLSDTLSLNESSNPKKSSFTLIPRDGGQQWQVGDQLKVIINMRDFQGNPKKVGGDFLIARLHNPLLLAGVAGHVVDHLNGSYSAVFPLLWDGKAVVEVKLVHPSEAISVLRNISREQPDRVKFSGVFHEGNVSETTLCSICLRPTGQPICDFTDIRTGEPWFCYKPKQLHCDSRLFHSNMSFGENFGVDEKLLFQSETNLKVAIPASGPESVTVYSIKNVHGISTSGTYYSPDQLGVRGKTLDLGISGYYYHGLWQSLTGTPIQHLENTAIGQCLYDKALYLFGDSTIRQWFTYFLEKLPELKQFDRHTSELTGPLLALDYKRNIMLRFRIHGPPIHFSNVPVPELHYIANELDKVSGRATNVVVIGIWSHLGAFPIRVYIRRLQSIRQAVIRLLTRAPKTIVVIRTANLQKQTPSVTWVGSDWFSLERDKILRAVFKGVRVQWVDAWEMTLAHHLQHDLYPQDAIVKNMIDVLLSYICPQRIYRRGRVKHIRRSRISG